MSITTVPWVDGLTLGEALRRQAAELPDREALVFHERGFRATYRQYDALVDEVGKGLMAMDLAAGDHVAVWATNWPEWTLLQLATARIGAVLVTINPAYRAHELAYALEQSDARALFLIDAFKSSDYYALIAEACPELADSEPGELSAARFPRLRWVVSIPERAQPGMSNWSAMLGAGQRVSDDQLREREAQLSPGQPINLQYTSGTTGFPKGVLLSHRNLLLNATYVGAFQDLTAADRVCVPVPFYHCFGCVIGTLCCIVHGATMLVPSDYFDPTSTLDCLEVERATSIYGVPTMFIAELEDDSFGSRDLSSLRTGIMAGSPCPIEVMRRVVDDMGAAEMTIAYGLTEASPAITQTYVDDPIEVRVGTVGRAIPGVEVRVLDESGAVLGNGEQGELCARGHNVMIGYYKMPEETAAAVDNDGWLHTGDLTVRDDDGNFTITGRIKDMIIRGGENIYPREIEEFLFGRDDIEDVQVVGVYDPSLGEELCACIRARGDAVISADEIRTYCAAHLAHFKVPRYVWFVDEYPMTVTGKVRKLELGKLAEAHFGIAVPS